MTAKTRRLVFVSVLAVILTLPVEAVLLVAIQSTDTASDATLWASGLDSTQLSQASGQVETYPFVYRRALMTRLSPDARAAAWQAHIKRYAAAHPEFDATVLGALSAAVAAATPDAISSPTESTRANARAVADQLTTLLGKDQMEVLLYYLGPKDTTSASAVPLKFRVAEYLRDHFTVLARTPDCDCSTYTGCYGVSDVCVSNSLQYCNPVDQWPMCGLFWADQCDGHCTSGW